MRAVVIRVYEQFVKDQKGYLDITLQQKKELLFKIVQEIKKDTQAAQYIQFIGQNCIEKAKQLHQFQSMQNTFMVDCLRQSMEVPFVKEDSEKLYNFTNFANKNINK